MPLVGRFIGPVMRVEDESRWLAGLSMALDRGEPEPKALRTAGMLSAGWLRKRSETAARLAESGKLLGDAIWSSQVLERRLAGQIALTDSLPDPRKALKDIAEDAGAHAVEVSTRAGRTAGIAGTLVIALMMGVFVISMYLPLFNIPKIVGR
jgi:type II secretory pathway component PulF